MSLVERLGYKSLKHLHNEMDNNEIMEWAAYDLVHDVEWRKKYKAELDIEQQKNQTLEEEAEKIKAMLMGLVK